MNTSTGAPRVSIGLPVYNGERYLEEAVNTLLAQTHRDFELIICDNASNDGTEQIARRLARHDPRIRYVRHERNLGVARNFNEAFRLSKGEYFKWAACDDLVAPQLLERCLQAIEQDDSIVLVSVRSLFVGPTGERLPGGDDGLHLMHERASDRFVGLIKNIGWCNAQYGLMRADVLRRTRLFGSFVGSDVCFLAELSLFGKFCEIPEPLLYRRFHESASSSLSLPQLLAFYEPSREPRVTMRRWRHLIDNLVAICRAPIGTAEWLRTTSFLTRKAYWDRAALTGELTAAVRERFQTMGKSVVTL
jgi:glycosyltransferase involved in cell wall biosynthesis